MESIERTDALLQRYLEDNNIAIKTSNTGSSSFLYKKIYVPTPSGTLRLANPDPALDYIRSKVDLLWNTTDHAIERAIKLQILSDFTAIYNYDCENDERPDTFTPFDSETEKKEFVRLHTLVDDFALYLGSICGNYHDRMVKPAPPGEESFKKKIPVLDFEPFIIDYNELYSRAVNEYFGVLLGKAYPVNVVPEPVKDWEKYKELHASNVEYREFRGEQIPVIVRDPDAIAEDYRHAPGATFILPALIEHELILELSNQILYYAMRKMSDKIRDGLKLEDPEKGIYNAMALSINEHHGYFSGSEKKYYNDLYNLFVHHGVLKDDSDVKKVFTKNMILGSIFHSETCKKLIRPQYYNLLYYLFDTKHLNIRNAVMHGDGVTYDYLAIDIASVMLQFLWDMGYGDMLVGYEED